MKGWGTGLLLLGCWTASGQAMRHVVLIDIDGLHRETFVNAFKAGRLPNFQRAFADALWFDNAASVIPTVTMPAQASIATGAPPWRHGMVGNQWYDRDSGRLFDYMTTTGISCVYGFTILGGPGCLKGLGNSHLQTPTMYEAAAAAGLATIAEYLPYWKGAVRPGSPSAAEASAFLKNNTFDPRSFDMQMTARAIADLNSSGFPSILALYFAGADVVAHKAGIAAQTPYLTAIIDPLLGQILDAIEGFDPQWRSSTLFVLTADHGRTDIVPRPEDRQLAADLAAALPVNAHVAANGGVIYVYLEKVDTAAIAEVAGNLASDARLSATIASVRPREAGESARAGDLIVTLREGHFYTSKTSGSEHGSVYAEDVSVPLLVAAPGVPGVHIREQVSITQIARTVADYLGFPMPSADPALPLRNRSRTSAPK